MFFRSLSKTAVDALDKVLAIGQESTALKVYSILKEEKKWNVSKDVALQIEKSIKYVMDYKKYQTQSDEIKLQVRHALANEIEKMIQKNEPLSKENMNINFIFALDQLFELAHPFAKKQIESLNLNQIAENVKIRQQISDFLKSNILEDIETKSRETLEALATQRDTKKKEISQTKIDIQNKKYLIKELEDKSKTAMKDTGQTMSVLYIGGISGCDSKYEYSCNGCTKDPCICPGGVYTTEDRIFAIDEDARKDAANKIPQEQKNLSSLEGSLKNQKRESSFIKKQIVDIEKEYFSFATIWLEEIQKKLVPSLLASKPFAFSEFSLKCNSIISKLKQISDNPKTSESYKSHIKNIIEKLNLTSVMHKENPSFMPRFSYPNNL